MTLSQETRAACCNRSSEGGHKFVGKLEHSGEVTLVLGGARSGKSRLAEAIIAEAVVARESQAAIYVATAEARDEEMARRIAAHRERRGPNWRTLEIPLALAQDLPDLLQSEDPVLVDCLTLWLSNIMLAEREAETEIGALVTGLALARAPLVLVSNETGLGIVPDNALARRFRDFSGVMNQQIAAVANNVLLVAAGLPLVMKGRNPAPNPI
ncbi:MAG: bifunctional adenosylcobinamide kinase/adenosylcobinamide-phosphate guanylyltransferase [Alphaproteobacteria bacterium]|nr:bifunctional adenosylcobinamide kinase/adenosylcobinamide-phosphate guanylyltransferase [Alphaproteobacteria bacterium]MBL6951856.1 bifunctional adenosylcobinamide kinase/adenosylcobinamide-phosphate guanylyltransferase [Alphaproteobacteria bacterium]